MDSIKDGDKIGSWFVEKYINSSSIEVKCLKCGKRFNITSKYLRGHDSCKDCAVIEKNKRFIDNLKGTEYVGLNGLVVEVIGGESKDKVEVICKVNRVKQYFRLTELKTGNFNKSIFLREGLRFISLDSFNMQIKELPMKNKSVPSFCTVLCEDTGEVIERVKKDSIKDGTFSYKDKEKFLVESRAYYKVHKDNIITFSNGLKCKRINIRNGKECDLEVIGSNKKIVFKDVSYSSVTVGSFPVKYYEDLFNYIKNGEIEGVEPLGKYKYIGKKGKVGGKEVKVLDAVSKVKEGVNKRYWCTVKVIETGEIIEDLSLKSVLDGVARPVKVKVGDINTANTGQEMCVLELLEDYKAVVEFEDGTQVVTTETLFRKGRTGNPNFKKHGRGLMVDSCVGYINVKKVAYELSNPKGVYYICKCSKCGYKDILSTKEMLQHSCNKGILKIPEWVFGNRLH